MVVRRSSVEDWGTVFSRLTGAGKKTVFWGLVLVLTDQTCLPEGSACKTSCPG